MEEVYVEEVATLGEDMLVIRIYPTTPVIVLTYYRLRGISVVQLKEIFMDTVKHMLTVNVAVKRFGG